MKRIHIILAVLCLIVSMILSIQSPMNGTGTFVLNGNALSENAGFEDYVGMNYEENHDLLLNINDSIDATISAEITKQSDNRGSGKSIDLQTMELSTNIVNNVAIEDEYIEYVPSFEEQVVPETPSIKTEKVSYSKKYGSNIIEDFDTNGGNVKYMGNFKLTAYCPCTKCCGKWGANRPVDENGDVIVKTSSGARAYANHTIAVDPKVIPYGTTVIIERNGVFYEYVAEDCGGGIKGNRIDVYHDDHSIALEFGVRHGNVYILTD